eukprot:1159331-Pelagomonas_calceolata.AAC.4
MLNSQNLDLKEKITNHVLQSGQHVCKSTRYIKLRGFIVVGSDKYSEHLNNVLLRVGRHVSSSIGTVASLDDINYRISLDNSQVEIRDPPM